MFWELYGNKRRTLVRVNTIKSCYTKCKGLWGLNNE